MWQPIETAPKDGRPIDLWVRYPDYPNDDGRVPNAYWGTERTPFEDREVTGWCDPVAGIDGQPAPICDGDPDNPVIVTHWTPLPDPPHELSKRNAE